MVNTWLKRLIYVSIIGVIITGFILWLYQPEFIFWQNTPGARMAIIALGIILFMWIVITVTIIIVRAAFKEERTVLLARITELENQLKKVTEVTIKEQRDFFNKRVREVEAKIDGSDAT
ncbi:MAG: hypothetical protein FWB80_00825 [Defluviitaleaceae bacterium]|nr:hypothetical protein [Defluviitaleaceae bacterium]